VRPIKKLSMTLFSQKLKSDKKEIKNQARSPTRAQTARPRTDAEILGIPMRASELEKKYQLSEIEAENTSLTAKVAALEAKQVVVEDL